MITPPAGDALALFIDAVDAIAPENWDRPSNLDEWTVRELVGHATGSSAKIVTLVENGEVWARSEPADWIAEDPPARLRSLAERLAKALPGTDFEGLRVSPQGEVPLGRALCFPVADLTLHSWDLHRSQGRAVELPPALLTFCTEFVASMPEEILRRPNAFGPALPAPADATPTTRLMAHLGRTV